MNPAYPRPRLAFVVQMDPQMAGSALNENRVDTPRGMANVEIRARENNTRDRKKAGEETGKLVPEQKIYITALAR
jgi:hypothetical protein